MDRLTFKVLVIEDQVDSINVFRKRFENHIINHQGVVYSAEYFFLPVRLGPGSAGRWRIESDTVRSLIDFLKKIEFNLIFIDYSFVPSEMDEELTYKLSHHEIHKKEDLLGKYVLDASELFRDMYKESDDIKNILLNSNARILMYTYPADSLMHLLGDAKTRGNVLGRAIGKTIDVLDTRQLLYGGDKNLEKKHDRTMYPQLLIGYLNQLVISEMQQHILKLSSNKKCVI